MKGMDLARERKTRRNFPSNERNLLLFEQKQQLIIEYRRNLEFTKDEKDILLLSKLEHIIWNTRESRASDLWISLAIHSRHQ